MKNNGIIGISAWFGKFIQFLDNEGNLITPPAGFGDVKRRFRSHCKITKTRCREHNQHQRQLFPAPSTYIIWKPCKPRTCSPKTHNLRLHQITQPPNHPKRWKFVQKPHRFPTPSLDWRFNKRTSWQQFVHLMTAMMERKRAWGELRASARRSGQHVAARCRSRFSAIKLGLWSL